MPPNIHCLTTLILELNSAHLQALVAWLLCSYLTNPLQVEDRLSGGSDSTTDKGGRGSTYQPGELGELKPLSYKLGVQPLLLDPLTH